MLVKSEIKYIQNLSQKKFRDESGLFVAEGPKIINELLSEGKTVLHRLYATGEWENAYPSIAALLAPGECTTVTDAELERISFLSTPNQVLGIFKKPVLANLKISSDRLRLMLDTIQDPGNLGTIIRCADWFGITEILCSEETADAYAPKVVQASMGSIARVHIRYGSLEKFIQEHSGWTLYTAEMQGRPVSEMGKVQKGILVIGNESRGISPSLLAAAPHTSITIPRKGKADSLNAAAATAILLSHLT
ncbi:MAG: hypothetical protein RL732_916 [Bacteroidota bacterium]